MVTNESLDSLWLEYRKAIYSPTLSAEMLFALKSSFYTGAAVCLRVDRKIAVDDLEKFSDEIVLNDALQRWILERT